MTISTRSLPLLCAALTLPVSQMVFQGCATVLDGPRQGLEFDSRPPGATVFVNGKAIGLTPTTLFVSRWSSPRVRVEMPGFEPYELQLEKTINSNVSGNILLGFAPVVVDAVTGSIFTLDVQKSRKGELQLQPWDRDTIDTRALFIGVVLKPAPHARKIGQMERKGS